MILFFQEQRKKKLSKNKFKRPIIKQANLMIVSTSKKVYLKKHTRDSLKD